MTRSMAALGLSFLLTGLLAAQTDDSNKSKVGTFELADVHVSAPGTASAGGFMPGGRIELRGGTLLELIGDAWGLDNAMIIGGPAWLNTDKFDLIAKAPAASTPIETLQVMLKNLLIDRFHLVAHEEKRDSPVFILSVAKGGSKMKRSATEDHPAGCDPGTGDPAINIHRLCHDFTMEMLGDFLQGGASNYVNHPVIDETHLKGKFDFPLDWMGRGIYNAARANPDGPAPVSIFDALEKIGLKLEAGTRPQPALVIDSVNETPTPNVPGMTAKIPTYPTEFEVAEVRPAKTAPKPGTGPLGQVDFRNGRMQFIGATLKGLISFAYSTNADRIVDTPKWMDEDRFDIIAKGPATAPEEVIQGMLKTLLIERFQLQTHNEDRPVKVFALFASKKPKLKESDGKQRSDCNIEFISERRTLVCKNTTMAQLAERLPEVAAAYVKPPLMDFTELKGAYDFDLYWTPKNQLDAARARPTDSGQAAAPSNDLTLAEALDKQLGIRLDEQMRPLPVMLIDHANQVPVQK